MMTCHGRNQHIKPALAELLWLQINKRIIFKIVTLTYNIKTTGHPIYLRNLLPHYEPEPVRELHSSPKQLLQVHVAGTVLSSRGFSHSASQTRNNLPFEIKNSPSIDNFKTKHETHLFNSIFANWSIFPVYE